MSKKDQEHIFEKFKRISAGGEGHGLGLYLVNTIVGSAAGRITIESEPGKGSTFTISLKLA